MRPARRAAQKVPALFPKRERFQIEMGSLKGGSVCPLSTPTVNI